MFGTFAFVEKDSESASLRDLASQRVSGLFKESGGLAVPGQTVGLGRQSGCAVGESVQDVSGPGKDVPSYFMRSMAMAVMAVTPVAMVGW